MYSKGRDRRSGSLQRTNYLLRECLNSLSSCTIWKSEKASVYGRLGIVGGGSGGKGPRPFFC